MWTYVQSTGEMLRPDGTLLATGYSGAEPHGVNVPAMQDVPDVGPIPEGRYSIGLPYADPVRGPIVMRLTPDPKNEMFDRSGFLIHGDSVSDPGTASEGCIILPHEARLEISESPDKNLLVESGTQSIAA